MPSAAAAAAEMLAQKRRHRMRHRDVGNAAPAEERTLALMRAVDELVDQNESAGRQVLPERAAGRERDQIGDAGALEHVDIGAIVDVGRRERMALVVTRQEDDRQAGDIADAQRRRGLPPRAGDVLFADILQPRQIVDAGAADNAEYGVRHLSPAGPARKLSVRAMSASGHIGRPKAAAMWKSSVARNAGPDLLFHEIQEPGEHQQEDHDLQADALARFHMRL